MALADDLYELATRARHAETRGAPAREKPRAGLWRETAGAREPKIAHWRTDFQWDEHVAARSSHIRGRSAGLREATREATGHWWLWLLAGIAWIVVSLIVLQFDAASVTTVSVLVGLMFALAAVENFALVEMPGAVRGVSAGFGALFVIAEIVCLVNPTETFAALADTLGFVFGLVGVWWMIQAFLERPLNPLWWMGLIAGILMTGLAFWTAGQLFMHTPYELLVCAGFWALMQGITHIARAFAIRRLHDELEGRGAE
jgi:uncharacterized membrane protein HdeD (DUF308 family)